MPTGSRSSAPLSLGIAATLALSASAGGCGADGGSAAARTGPTIDTLASGRVVVTNDRGDGWNTGEGWTLTEDLRLGSLEGGGPDVFGQVAWILPDSAGGLYVLDFQSQDIRVFDAEGGFRGRIGRQGEGPGELSGAAGMAWAPDGRLWVWGSQRYSVFEPSGEFVTSHPRRLLGVIYPWRGGFVDGGRFIDWGLERPGRFFGPLPPGTPPYDGTTVFHPVEFVPPDTFDSLPPLVFEAEVTPSGESKLGGRASLAVTLDPSGGTWSARMDEYTIHRVTEDGDTVRSFSLPASPMPIPEAEIDSLIRAASQYGPPPDRERYVTRRRLVTRLLHDGAGHLYVFPQEEGIPQGTVVDVFTDGGVYLGRMDLPDPILIIGPPPRVTRDHLFAVVVDELDVPYVVRYRIDRTGG